MTAHPQETVVHIVSTMHPIDDGRVAHKMASSFRDRGHVVRWIGPDRRHSGGEPAGIERHLYPFRPTRRGRLTHAWQTWRRAVALGRCDLVYAPEIDSALIAILLKRRGYCRQIMFDVHELYGAEHLRRWVPAVLQRPFSWCIARLIRLIASGVDLVVTVNAEIRTALGDFSAPSAVLTNSPTRAFAARIRELQPPSRPTRFTLLHGKSSAQHGTEQVLSALGTLSDLIDLRLLLFEAFDPGLDDGMTRQRFERLVAELNIESSIDVLPQLPYAEMPGVMATASAGVIAYGRELGRLSLPNRPFECMAGGIPVIVPSYAVAMAEVVTDAQCGLLVDTEKPDEIASAVRRLYEDREASDSMGLRGRAAFLAKFSWEAQFDEMLAQTCLR